MKKVEKYLHKTEENFLFSVREEVTFSAQHQIRLPNGELEPLHSHQWKVRVYVSSKELDRLGLVTDFVALKETLTQIVGEWEGKNLNKIPPFSEGINPSAEMVAYEVYRKLREKLQLHNGYISKIEVREAPTSWAILEIK